MRFRVLERGAGDWDLYWGDEAAPSFEADRRYRHSPWPDDEEFTVVQYDLEGILNGALIHLRLDPTGVAGTVLEVDYVRFGRISDDSDEDGLPDTVEPTPANLSMLVTQARTRMKPTPTGTALMTASKFLSGQTRPTALNSRSRG